MRLPSGLNATLDTASVCPLSGGADRLAGVGVPHLHRLVPAAGDDALAVGAERHAEHLAGVAGERQADRWPVSASHTLTVLSPLPETMRVPSGLNATLLTRSGVAVEGCADRWPVSASHTLTVLSSLPETMRLPSGLNATLVTASVWPVSGCADGWPVSASHTLTVAVDAAGDDACAVGAERHARAPGRCGP